MTMIKYSGHSFNSNRRDESPDLPDAVALHILSHPAGIVLANVRLLYRRSTMSVVGPRNGHAA